MTLPHPLRRQPPCEGHAKDITANTGAAKRVRCFFADTINFGITYKKKGVLPSQRFRNFIGGNSPDIGPVSLKEREVSIHYVPTTDNMSDLKTKILSKNRHRYLIHDIQGLNRHR